MLQVTDHVTDLVADHVARLWTTFKLTNRKISVNKYARHGYTNEIDPNTLKFIFALFGDLYFLHFWLCPPQNMLD